MWVSYNRQTFMERHLSIVTKIVGLGVSPLGYGATFILFQGTPLHSSLA